MFELLSMRNAMRQGKLELHVFDILWYVLGFCYHLFCHFIIRNVIRIDKCLIRGNNSCGILTKQQQQEHDWSFALFFYHYLICRKEIIVIIYHGDERTNDY